ncbi:DUF397 domain-containing protein [Streptomyces sp. ACA25]|uniref:DUF397 domain-containing protein n=1 Tax=Streptomyces sp. ACA25 TaxID=3022596 RepID=UPI002306E909|nr:DUF397 domain-containing protein [Streptomyces sp. ACA25]MDB1087980.1 DUF397 domain-containing protein [Streptomyces sp. ACA25]
MTTHNWQKSSFSADAANCLNVATTAGGGTLFRESDDPDTVLATTPTRLAALLAGVKSGAIPLNSSHTA